MFTTVYIQNNEDILKLNRKLKERPEMQYIAVELAQNMVDKSQTGEIRFNGKEAYAIIDKKTIKNVDEIKEAIETAKKIYSEGGCGSINSTSRGRGLISIIYAGWDLNLLDSEKNLKVCAKKLETGSTALHQL